MMDLNEKSECAEEQNCYAPKEKKKPPEFCRKVDRVPELSEREG